MRTDEAHKLHSLVPSNRDTEYSLRGGNNKLSIPTILAKTIDYTLIYLLPLDCQFISNDPPRPQNSECFISFVNWYITVGEANYTRNASETR